MELAVKSDVEQLKILWKEVFGDDDWFVDRLFSLFDKLKFCVYRQAGQIISSMTVMDMTFRGQKFAYIYGVMTKKEERGKGYFSRLMAEVAAYLENEGYVACVLMPAEKSLFELYEKHGFETKFYVKQNNFTPSKLQPQTLDITPLSINSPPTKEQFDSLIFADNVLTRDYDLFCFTVDSYVHYEGFFASFKGGYIFARAEEDRLIIDEVTNYTGITLALNEYKNVKEILVNHNGLFDSGKNKPVLMCKALKSVDFGDKIPYANMMLN